MVARCEIVPIASVALAALIFYLCHISRSIGNIKRIHYVIYGPQSVLSLTECTVFGLYPLRFYSTNILITTKAY